MVKFKTDYDGLTTDLVEMVHVKRVFTYTLSLKHKRSSVKTLVLCLIIHQNNIHNLKCTHTGNCVVKVKFFN